MSKTRTPSPSKTLSGLFLAAAKRVEQGKNVWLCSAVEQSRYPLDLRIRAKVIITDRLDGHIFYTGWVRANHPHLHKKSILEDTLQNDMREGRIAWCHALAEEFKDK